MKKLMKRFACPVMFFLCLYSPARAQNNMYAEEVKKRLDYIQQGLDTMLFVKRFESVETACLCIDPVDHKLASPGRTLLNSDYRQRFAGQKNKIDSGVECLSKYYARYAKFKVTGYDVATLTISGRAKFTYGYPAGDIIQYLGMTAATPRRDSVLFSEFMGGTGEFTLTPENNNYKISLVLQTGPYNQRDTFYGYLEITQGVFLKKPGFTFYFTEMNISKGDRNNQIFLKFSSTSHQDESRFYTGLLYNFLSAGLQPAKTEAYAKAIWLKSFFGNPACVSCAYIYGMVKFMLHFTDFRLPNTEPFPPR